jgi:molybdopterin/thiamine biosynthesis adenylyltransferase
VSYFLHESLFRGQPLLARLASFPVTICGAGALGANLAETLARMGFGSLRVIDRDRIEERNLSTQPWHRGDVGGKKATMLAHMLYRAIKVEVEACPLELTSSNARRLLKGSGLIVDAFDNSVSRRLVGEARGATPCLHVGLAADYAEVVWDENYTVPSGARDDVCDYPLARTLVLLAVATAAEIVVDFVATGQRHGATVTLRDLSVRRLASR